jgi:hypothetical protein
MMHRLQSVFLYSSPKVLTDPFKSDLMIIPICPHRQKLGIIGSLIQCQYCRTEYRKSTLALVQRFFLRSENI